MNWKELWKELRGSVLTVLVLLGILAVVVYLPDILPTSSKSKVITEKWNVYLGHVGNYNVRISESKQYGSWDRMVHLTLPKEQELNDLGIPIAITGHDYNGDGRFDRLLIRKELSQGYNSVIFKDKVGRRWDPCVTDKNKVEPFSDEQVYAALHKLYSAINDVYNPDHQTVDWRPQA